MEDIMGLISRDLLEKGLAPDPESIVIRAQTMQSTEVDLRVPRIEIDVNVSWVGIASDNNEPSTPPVRPRRPAPPDTDVPVPPADLRLRKTQYQVAPHRMGETIKRWGTIWEDDFAHEFAKIGIMMSKTVSVTFQRVTQRPRRAALAAPIHGGNREPSPP